MILLNDFRRQWADLQDSLTDAFQAVGESGWYILGREVTAFESGLASYWGLPHCVGVASGLDAIEIGLRALGCKPGDRVLTTPLSAFATTLAIVKLGAIPVFVDTDANGNIDLDQCDRVLRSNQDIRFLVPVHLYGNPLDLTKLAALKAGHGLYIVEDCAQSAGATDNGRPAGSVGECAATSFYPTKNLGALGDGGALLTNSETLARAARTLRDYGQSAKYEHAVIGYNSRLDELQAALLHRVMLPALQGWTERRREIAARYRAGIRNERLRLLSPAGSASPCWHLFPVFVDNGPAAFREFLKNRAVQTAVHYPATIPSQPALAAVAYEMPVPCRLAEQLAAREVSLPIHPYLTDDEIGQVIEAVNGWR